MHNRQVPSSALAIPELPQKQRRLWVRIIRILFGIIITIIITAVLAFSCLIIYLQQNPTAVTHRLSTALQTYANIDSSFGDVQVLFFPVPALAISNIILSKDELTLSIAYAAVTPSLWSIVTGNMELGNVTLLRPRLHGTLLTEDNNQNVYIADKEKENIPINDIAEKSITIEDIGTFIKYPSMPIADILHNSHIKIMHGSVDIYSAERHIVSDIIQAHLDVNIFNTANISIQLGTTALFARETLLGKIDNLNVELNNISAQPNSSVSPFFALNGRLHIPDIIQDTQLNILLSYTHEKELLLQGQWATEGQLLWHDQPIHFAIAGQGQSPVEKDRISIQNMSIALDKDIVNLTATAQGLDTFPPTIEGTLTIGHLSLVRWFGFARLLAPGLQRAVHTIRGSLDFILDEQGLDVPRIEAYAADGHFKGHGGVEYWNKPVIFLDLTAPHLVLRKAYPEAEGEEAEPVTLAYASLTPIPGSAAAANMSGPSINYDINIAAQEVEAWKLSVGDVSFRCIPSTLAQDKVQKNGVFMDFAVNKLYGGHATGTLLLSEDAKGTTLYDINASIRNAIVEKMLHSIGEKRILGGRLFMDTSFTSKGSQLGEFLTSPQGNINIRVEKGFFASTQQKDMPFENLSLVGHITHSHTKTPPKGTLPTTLRYEGTWKGNIQSPDINGSINIKGPLSFSDHHYSSVHMDNVLGKISLSLSKNLTQLPITLETDIIGHVNFHTKDGYVGLRNTHATITTLANMHILGDVMASFPKKATKSAMYNATIQAKSNNFFKILQIFGVDPQNLTDFKVSQTMDVRADLQYHNNIFTAKTLNANFDTTKITGNIQGDFTHTPAWTFALHSTLLDINRFIHTPQNTPSSTPQNTHASTVSNTTTKPWSLTWLTKHNAQGTLSIDHVRFASWSFRHVHIPLLLKKGILESKNTSAILCDSKAHIHLKATPSNNTLIIQGGGAVTDMNLLTLSTENSLNPRLEGKGSVWLSLQGTLRQGKGILSAMDGTWRVEIKKSFLQDYNTAGKKIGSPTYIDRAKASGTITKGVLGSNNILIQGPDLYISGKGWLNPIEKNLDVNLIVSKPPFTDLPVRYHGSLSEPTQSVSTGAAIVNILSNTLNIFGKAMGEVFSIFTRSDK